MRHLWEEEVGVGAGRGRTSERTSAVELPVPDAERNDVGQIDGGRRSEQRTGLTARGARDKFRIEQDR